MPYDKTKHVFSLLDKKVHNRAGFSCGKPSLDNYIKNTARQDVERRAAVVYILSEVEDPATIIGYYTLSSTGVILDAILPDLAEHFPRYPVVGATLLGRLAVNEKYKEQGFGRQLLKHALKTSYEKSKEIASAMVVVDALDNDAKKFYLKYGLIQLTNDPMRLYIHMDTVKQSIAE